MSSIKATGNILRGTNVAAAQKGFSKATSALTNAETRLGGRLNHSLTMDKLKPGSLSKSSPSVTSLRNTANFRVGSADKALGKIGDIHAQSAANLASQKSLTNKYRLGAGAAALGVGAAGYTGAKMRSDNT